MNASGKAIVGTLAMVSLGARLVFAQPPAADLGYTAREAAAAPQIRATLGQLRAQIASQNLTFTVGYTSALDRPLSELAGTRAPADLKAKMREQNLLAKPRSLQSAPRMAVPCSASAASFDWRKFNKVTLVRDQKSCGSCWAFGTLGAFEGSYARVENALIDTSEQDVLSCSHDGSCNGGWWAFDYVESTGVAGEEDYPYTATDVPCRTDVPRPFRALTWGYVSQDSEIPDVASLKQALCDHGPVAIAVNVTTAFQAYTGGVFNEHDPGQINHAITLIGWDDAKQAWLIKNSWGHAWGETGGFGTESGYMWISYDSNKVGYGAAWVEPVSALPPLTPTQPPPPPTPVPGLSVWMVIILALGLGLLELYRRRRGSAGTTRP
jgi:C1A family cysteine protease